jgi:hypothetical protein
VEKLSFEGLMEERGLNRLRKNPFEEAKRGG